MSMIFLKNIKNVVIYIILVSLLIGAFVIYTINRHQLKDPKFISSMLWIDEYHKNETIEKVIDIWLNQSSGIVAQLPWGDNKSFFQSLDWYNKIARLHHKQFMINIDWQRNDRHGTRGGWKFSDYKVRRKFSKDMIDIVNAYKPDYLTLGVEVNYYAIIDKVDFDAFVDLIIELKDALKEISPITKIGLSFQLELTLGMHSGWNVTKPLQSIELVIDSLDYFGISTYPDISSLNGNCCGSIEYIDYIVNKYDISFGILETGVSSEYFDVDYRLEYIRKVFQKFDELNMQMMIWGSLIDKTNQPIDWTNTIGLINYDGRPKDDFIEWKKLAIRELSK